MKIKLFKDEDEVAKSKAKFFSPHLKFAVLPKFYGKTGEVVWLQFFEREYNASDACGNPHWEGMTWKPLAKDSSLLDTAPRYYVNIPDVIVISVIALITLAAIY